MHTTEAIAVSHPDLRALPSPFRVVAPNNGLGPPEPISHGVAGGPAARPVAELRANPLNPRGDVAPASVEDLAASIAAQGILQPLLITPDGTVVAGHRRLAAARLVGLREVPVIERKLTETEQIEIMLVENIQREDLSPLQEARAYRRLLDEGGSTLADVSRRVGVTTSRVQSRLVILTLDPAVQEMYGRNELPTSIAAALAKVVDGPQQRRLANVAARRQLPASRIEELIKRSLGTLEKEAARRTPAEEAAPAAGASKTRGELIERLRAEPETTISFVDLARAVEDTCCWCGLGSAAEVCASCPVPQLVRRALEIA